MSAGQSESEPIVNCPVEKNQDLLVLQAFKKGNIYLFIISACHDLIINIMILS